MSDYIFGSSLSYSDYLQARSFERSLKGEISSGTKAIIASNEQLQRANISVLESVSSSVTEGFDNLTIQFAEISGGLNQLNSTFRWGFSELLTQTGRVNDSLQDLIQLASTPAQTWAYEQFEIARDADRKGLFEEALEYLDRAINGYGGQTGYKLEYRFHFLLGRIKLGSFKNSSKEVVNLQEAEIAFLKAARYSAQDAPKEASRALLAAGWADYCRGEMNEAQRHTEEAISWNPEFAEAQFQLAKVLMHIHEPSHALNPLQKAIELDRGYAIKAAADGDFQQHESELLTLLEQLRLDAKKRAERCLSALDTQRAALEARRETEFPLVEKLGLEQFSRKEGEAIRAASNETFYGFLDALEACREAYNELGKVLENALAANKKRSQEIENEERFRSQQEAAAEATRLRQAKDKAHSAFGFSLAGLLCVFLAPVGLILGILACSRYGSLSSKDGFGFAIAAVVIGGLLSAFLLLYFLAAFFSIAVSGR